MNRTLDTSDLAEETAAVRARSEAVAAAEAAFDIPTALTFWADDAILQPAGMPQIEGKEAVRGLYAHFFESGMVREFSGAASHIEVSGGGDMAYEYGINRMVMAGEDGDLLDVGKYLLIWRKIATEWMVVALSFTSDTPAPMPIAE
jgi:ketosteroid isomerase-like protein